MSDMAERPHFRVEDRILLGSSRCRAIGPRLPASDQRCGGPTVEHNAGNGHQGVGRPSLRWNGHRPPSGARTPSVNTAVQVPPGNRVGEARERIDPAGRKRAAMSSHNANPEAWPIWASGPVSAMRWPQRWWPRREQRHAGRAVGDQGIGKRDEGNGGSIKEAERKSIGQHDAEVMMRQRRDDAFSLDRSAKVGAGEQSRPDLGDKQAAKSRNGNR